MPTALPAAAAVMRSLDRLPINGDVDTLDLPDGRE